MVNWGNHVGTMWEPMRVIFQDDLISIAMYAKDNGLLTTDGWRSCKRYVSNAKKLSCMVNQAKLKSMRNWPVYTYGVQVPRNHREAMKLDEKAGNTMQADAEALEIGQLAAYNTFEDAGLGTPIPDGYTSIPVHLVYDVKHNGRHKAHMVAGSHRTSVYSGGMTLAGIKTVTFLAKLNGLDLWCINIGNAYLERYTKEKVAFIAGLEFGELEGHTPFIVKVFNGLRSSGARWHL
jgi:hypothetical protein